MTIVTKSAMTCLCTLMLVVGLAETVTAQRRGLPNQNYYLPFTDFYQGDYRRAGKDFESGARTAYKFGTSRYLDSICFWTMTGECHYHLGNYSQAIQMYEQALDLYLSYTTQNWQSRLKMPPSIQADNAAGQRARITWGAPARNATIPRMPDTFSIMFGRMDAERALQEGGLVQNAEFRQMDLNEIMRCTALAIHRRRVIKGPTCQYDPFTIRLVNGLRGTNVGDGSLMGAYNGVLLGIAEASIEEWERAARTLKNSLQFKGDMDHPLTPVALIELANIGLQTDNLTVASQLALEASFSAAVFYQYDLVSESLELASQIHLLKARSPYPPLEPAITWARKERARMMQAALSVRLAECLAEAGSTDAAANVLRQSAGLMTSRNSLGNTPIAARMKYVAALAEFLRGNFASGKNELAGALASFQNGSLWLYRLGLADQLIVRNNVTQRQADLLYGVLLHDPSEAEWKLDPLECLSFLTANHVGPLERWFEIVVRRKDHDRAIGIAEMVRRHRFFAALPLGGRLMAFRWVMHAPEEALTEKALDQRRSFLARNTQYQQWSQRAAEIRTALMLLPLKPEEKSPEQREQIKLIQELAQVSDLQEAMLASFALRREPAEMAFPPQSNYKEFQKTIAKDELALVTLAASGGYHLFFVNATTTQYIGLARTRDVVRGVGGILKKLGLTESAVDIETLKSDEWKELAAELSISLLGDVPANSWQDVRELVIVPDGLLWYMPFELLQVGEEGAKKNLADELDIRYSPTLFLAYGGQRPQRRLEKTAVVTARMHPRMEPEMTDQVYEKLSPNLPTAVKFDRAIRFPTNLLGSLLDELVVWSDVLISRGAGSLQMRPMQLDQSDSGSSLAAWMSLPWNGPEHVVMPGFQSDGGTGLRGKLNGTDLFLTTMGFMASGTRTILVSRWRTGGQQSLELSREYVERLPEMTPQKALRESIAANRQMKLDYEKEPRIRAKTDDEVLAAEHPMFWSGSMLFAIPEKENPQAVLPPAAVAEPPNPADKDADKGEADDILPDQAKPDQAKPDQAKPDEANMQPKDEPANDQVENEN